jgi:hypothetical protein
MRPDVALAFDDMASAARREAGLYLLITSSYRSDVEKARSTGRCGDGDALDEGRIELSAALLRGPLRTELLGSRRRDRVEAQPGESAPVSSTATRRPAICSRWR